MTTNGILFRVLQNLSSTYFAKNKTISIRPTFARSCVAADGAQPLLHKDIDVLERIATGWDSQNNEQ